MKAGFLTRERLVSWGGEAVFVQAAAIAKRGMVLRCDEEPGGLVKGIILRTGMSEIRTKMQIQPDGSIRSLCPCATNQRDGMICAHVVALGIVLMQRANNPERERRYQEEMRHARRIEAVKESSYIRRGPNGMPARVVLSVPNSWKRDFAEKRKVSVNLFFLATAQGTERLPPFTPATLPPGRGLRITPEDENTMCVLEDICEGPPPPRFEVSASDFLGILDVAKGTLILEGGRKPLASANETATCSLKVTLDEETGELELSAQASPAGEFFVDGNRGCAFDGTTFRKMDKVLPLPYHSLYRVAERIPRERVIPFLDNDIPTLRKLMPVEMPIDSSLFERVPGRPVFVLEVQGSRASLVAQLKARYGKQELPAGGASAENVSELDCEDLLKYRVRNLPAERLALEHLPKAGFKQEDGKWFIIGTREVLNFLGGTMPSLGRLGWKIKLSPSLEAIAEDIPVVTPVVQIAEEGGGKWFDVGFDFELPGGKPLPQTEVQRAINCGDSFIQKNGKTYLIDCDAVKQMRSVFNDCDSREGDKPGHFRMRQVYAPFVQSSLEAMEGIDIDQPPLWREKAAKRNREGKDSRIKPVPLGDGLEEILRPYQKEGVAWMRFLETSGMNGLLADEMGLGKTLQTLAWLSLKREDPDAQGKPAIVVCPTSLVANWEHEAAKFLPRLKRLVINGPDRAKLFEQIPQSDLVITSYALARRDMDRYEGLKFSAAVLDEAQHIKNRTTQNAVAVKKLDASCRLALTGTPIENGVQDVWSIMDFLMPEYLGPWREFHENYEVPLAEEGSANSPVQRKLRRKLHPFILRRVKRDVAKDLPDKIVKVQYCRMTEDQERVYYQILNESRAKIKGMVKEKGFERSRFEILALLTKLRQASCHLGLLADRQAKPDEKPSAKTEAFLELLDEAVSGGHRILLFSQYVKMLSLLRRELDARNIQYCYLDGSTKDRLEQCQRFNLTPSIPLFLISLKAGGTGLNLTGADMVVHFDPWWNPAAEDQATDRAHRIGQKRTVYAIKLIAEHSVEERVLAMQRKKQELISATIGASDEAIVSKLSFQDIQELIGL